jgi:hypothetical protein
MQNAPAGVELSVHSMKDSWPVEWQGTFDLIHQRMAFPAAGPKIVKQVISNMIGLLKPGGWIQFVESDHSLVEGPAMAAMVVDYGGGGSVMDLKKPGDMITWMKVLLRLRTLCSVLYHHSRSSSSPISSGALLFA